MASSTQQTGEHKALATTFSHAERNIRSNNMAVNICLKVITNGESHPDRSLKLDAENTYTVRIGRGSRSGSKDLYPAENNAWFESRVMSREHAILKAHPGSKVSSTRQNRKNTAYILYRRLR